MQTIYKGRTYDLKADERQLPNMRVSQPIGRQRKTFVTLFFRSAKTGAFVPAL